jgi:hypothetical protein
VPAGGSIYSAHVDTHIRTYENTRMPYVRTYIHTYVHMHGQRPSPPSAARRLPAGGSKHSR